MEIFQRGIFVIASIACQSINIASAAEYASEQAYLEEFPVILSASRLSQRQSEAPNAVTVINREMIKASGFRNIADLFRLVPGMYVGYENGHFPIVAYHGSTDQYSRRMQVLVDGRSVYLPPFSNVPWGDIPLHIADIERIEIVRGPAAATYGANSLQGVINIITRDASSADRASVSVIQGDGGVSDVAAHMGKTGAKLDYRVTLAHRADNGFDTSVLNDNSVTRVANLRANFHPDSRDSFDLQLGYSESMQGEGVAGRATDPFVDVSIASNFQQLSWIRALPQFDEFKLSYYHIFRGSKIFPGLHYGNVAVHRHELEMQHTMHFGASNRLVWGGGARSDTARASAIFTSAQSLHESRLFAHDEWRMSEAVVLNVGAMLENDGLGHRNTSPRASLNYHLTPQHTLRAGTSVAYRNPAMAEESINIPGQFLALGGLKPEKVHSKEIGYLGEFNGSRVTVDARLYYDKVSDIIFTDPAPLAPPSFDGKPYGFGNLMSAIYKGFEGTIKHNWGEKSNLIFNFSRQRASCSATGTLREPAFLPILQVITASCSSMVPLNSGSILWNQQVVNDFQFSVGYYHQGEMKIIDTQGPESAMRRVDVRVSKVFGKPVENGGGDVALVVQNAFRNRHTEYTNVPQTNGTVVFNRRVYLSATFGF